MNVDERLDLMVDALDLLGRLDDPQLAVITGVMQAMLPTRTHREAQKARILAKTEQLDDDNRLLLTALVNIAGRKEGRANHSR